MLIDRHTAIFLLRNCFAMPKLLYPLLSSPCFTDSDSLKMFDDVLRSALTEICNVDFDDVGWTQATLPLRHGGLGIRSASDIALPAFLSSAFASSTLVSEILSSDSGTSLRDEALSEWSTNISSTPPSRGLQRGWDDLMSKSRQENLRPRLDQHRLACLAAASQPASGAWLQAIPSSSTGTLLDDEAARLAVALRLGLPVCEPHPCRCGGTVDNRGLHPLSCRRSAGRFPRHSALNDVVRRSLDAAGIPSCLEPAGLDRGDGKRPDGLTLFPFSRGKSLVWDATCVDTFSATNVCTSATEAGSAAAKAEHTKTAKYAALSDRFVFQPVAVETSGAIGPSTLAFLRGVGLRISCARVEPRETEWLLQRVSLAIVRGNAMSIRLAGVQHV